MPWTTLAYDAAGRLMEIASGSTTTRFGYDGLDRIAEYDGTNALLRRYVHGPGWDEPIVWYEGSGTSDRRFIASDERGSTIALTDSSGAVIATNRYDEYGIPQTNGSGVNVNTGKFQYTGQAWLPELGLQYSKARIYSPTLGRFLQTDPIGYADSANLYAYVLNDPVNLKDPWGLSGCDGTDPSADCGDIVICGGGVRVTNPWTGGESCVRLGAVGRFLESLASLPVILDSRTMMGPGGRGGGESQPPSEACKGPVLTYSRGGSITLAPIVGGNAGVSVNISCPLQPDLSNPLRGIQISFTGQGAAMLGFGAFAGYGATSGIGVSGTHHKTGLTSSRYVHAEANLGAGPAVGGSVQGNRSGLSGSVSGKVGVGAGAYIGAGVGKAYTFALDPFFC